MYSTVYGECTFFMFEQSLKRKIPMGNLQTPRNTEQKQCCLFTNDVPNIKTVEVFYNPGFIFACAKICITTVHKISFLQRSEVYKGKIIIDCHGLTMWTDKIKLLNKIIIVCDFFIQW